MDAILVRDLEQKRQALQAELDKGKSQAERNRLGQFPTPSALATDIMIYARRLLAETSEIRFMDPAFGTGSFYSAFLTVFPREVVTAAWGYEIDPYYAEKTLVLWKNTSLRLNISDFTKIGPPNTNAEKPNLLVCNPPYVRHHHLENGDKLRLQKEVARRAGVSLSGLAGFYCYYMLLSHPWLADDGLAAWLVPSEFMDVNYGREVKQYLLNAVTLLRIHRFDPQDVQFEDALVSSSVVWFRKTRPTTQGWVEFTFGGTLASPDVSGMVSTETLHASLKWTQFPQTDVHVQIAQARAKVTLSDLFTIRRGIATGNNGYFILTEEQIREHGLPSDFLVPILPSARYLEVDEIHAEKDGNPEIDRPLFLLSCNLPEDVVKRQFPLLSKYYQAGIDARINEQYLCQHRDPWYAQEHRSAAPLLCTYMGRGGAKSEKPFRFILNHSNAIAANAYLMLYPKPFLCKAIAGNPDRMRDIWKALNGIRVEELTGAGRIYGGGLHKIEPKELGNVSADCILSLLPELLENQLPGQMTLFDLA